MKFNVQDLSRATLLDSTYDVAFFSLGYEPRCTYVPSLLKKANVTKSAIFAYSENHSCSSRMKSYDYFKKYWTESCIVELKHSSVREVYTYISEVFNQVSGDKIRVLVDYSSMSRNWYAALLNYLTKSHKKDITIDLVYSNAEYPSSEDFYEFELGDVKVLPGCEGSSITKKKKAAIFMLGFDKVGPQSFYNLLEPEVNFGVIAAPGAMPGYEEIALNLNKDFISHQLNDGENLLKLPISSIEVTFENICQIIQPLKLDYNTSIIQFGPKPHIVASTLAGILFENVSCIFSEYSRSKPHNVVASGDLSISRVSLRKM